MHVREEQLPSPGRDSPEKLRKGLVGVTAIGTRDRQAQSWAEPGKPGLGVRASPPLTPSHESHGKSMLLL